MSIIRPVRNSPVKNFTKKNISKSKVKPSRENLSRSEILEKVKAHNAKKQNKISNYKSLLAKDKIKNLESGDVVKVGADKEVTSETLKHALENNAFSFNPKERQVLSKILYSNN